MSDPSEAHHNQAWTAYQDCDHATEFMVCDDCVAKAIAAAEERGRRRGDALLRECDEALKTAMGTIECMSRFPPGHEFAGQELRWHKLAVAVRAKIAALAPRDSGKELDAGGAVNESRTRQDFEAMCPHNPCDEVNPHPSPWVGPICLDCMNAIVAAAEERGRRRGVEEAATLCDRRANGHVEGSVAGLEARKCANAVRDLAPRDSGKEG